MSFFNQLMIEMTSKLKLHKKRPIIKGLFSCKNATIFYKVNFYSKMF